MKKWKVSLPREKPPLDRANVVYAYRDSLGHRLEFDGVLDQKTAEKLMTLIIEVMSKEKK
jgi:hypothetical protein